MSSYTSNFGSQFPSQVMTLKQYENVSDTLAGYVNTIKSLRANGKYTEANEMIEKYKTVLQNVSIDASFINKLQEEIRNTQIYAKKHQQQVYFTYSDGTGDDKEEAEDDDIWMIEY